MQNSAIIAFFLIILFKNNTVAAFNSLNPQRVLEAKFDLLKYANIHQNDNKSIRKTKIPQRSSDRFSKFK